VAFWWVNHKQTFRHEFRGGYIWSPKRRKDGARNIFYDFMRMVRPGDFVFSYAAGLIRGAGAAKSHCYTSPRPDEFGHIGNAWDVIGWRVDVDFVAATNPIQPRAVLDEIGPYIGVRHSPLNADGTGRQAVYLAAIPAALGHIVADRIGFVVPAVQVAELGSVNNIEVELPGIDEWEQIEERKIESSELPQTERAALIKSRLGQGRFKTNVSRFETRCRVTQVSNPVHLVASHIKPWRESINEERLAAANGLLLFAGCDSTTLATPSMSSSTSYNAAQFQHASMTTSLSAPSCLKYAANAAAAFPSIRPSWSLRPCASNVQATE
jgi:putative restriction endonuclease